MIKSIIKSPLNFFEFLFIFVVSVIHIAIFYYFIPSSSLSTDSSIAQESRCRICDLPPPAELVSTYEDVVFAPCYENNQDLSLFFRSLRSTGFKGSVFLITDTKHVASYKSQLYDEITCGLKIISIKNTNGIDTKFRKYYDVQKYLSAPSKSFSRVLIADPKRVVFFKDPFDIFYNANRVYSLKFPIQKDDDRFPPHINSYCANLFNLSYNSYYDPVFIAGGQLQVVRSLTVFLNETMTKKCQKEDNDILPWSQLGNDRNFYNQTVRFLALVSADDKVATDAGSVWKNAGLENYRSANNEAPLPGIVIDYQKFTKMNSFFRGICKLK